ncbi:hypothetical protein LG52_2199 [Geobacillus kaustophilus]|uniref:Uncharacterized protein n=1 Tax=Geobacillus kaustophilus TaxID=1462 RepID=A0A0D8BR41_GEOKU|nr:hypothetical protein LG52_2199 [Geobacillus kaustophilus]
MDIVFAKLVSIISNRRLANQAEQSSQVEETGDEPTAPADETEETKNESAPSALESIETEKTAAAPAEDDTAVQLDKQADAAIKAERNHPSHLPEKRKQRSAPGKRQLPAPKGMAGNIKQ